MPRIREHLIEGTNRHGNVRYMFHRRPDGRRITIKGKPEDHAFEARYQFLVDGGDRVEDLERESIKRQRKGCQPELVRELVSLHNKHLERCVEQGTMSPRTVEHYTRFTKRFNEEFGGVPLITVAESHLVQVLQHWSRTANAHNNALRALKHLFGYAETHWSILPNPTLNIRKREVKTDGHLPWSHDQVRQFLEYHKLGSKAYLTMMLLLHAAPRLGDLVKLGPHNIKTVNRIDSLCFKPQKTQSVTVTVPLHPNLKEAIDATITGDDTFLITTYGMPHSPKAFGSQITEWRKQAGINESVSAHGLRKTVGIDLAENGATEYELMAWLGHTTPKVTEVYTRAARRNRLAFEAASKSTLGNIIESKPKDSSNE